MGGEISSKYNRWCVPPRRSYIEFERCFKNRKSTTSSTLWTTRNRKNFSYTCISQITFRSRVLAKKSIRIKCIRW